MASHEIKAQQHTNVTNPGVVATGNTPLDGPCKSQTPQKADAAKSAAKPKETFKEYMERKSRDQAEKNGSLKETATKNMQADKTAEENGLVDAGPNNSQQTVSKPQTATTSARSLNRHTRIRNKKQSKPASSKIWDGFITENPPFPLTEIIALKPSSTFANFYAFVRRNGRTGMIKTDLIQEILKNSPIVLLDDAEMMLAAVHPQPKTYKDQLAAEKKESRSTSTQQSAADNNSATEYEITRQTFEQVCDELKTYIEDMDTGSSVESKAQQTRLCIEALTTMSDKAKELHENSRAQQDNTEGVVATPSSSPTPSSTDREINKTDPKKKSKTVPILEVESLTDLKFGDFEGNQGRNATKDKGLHVEQLWQEWKKDTRELANDEDQGPMSYSEAAKAAARYYALTSAYGKPV